MTSDQKEIVRRGYDAVSERYRRDDDAPPEYATWTSSLLARLPPQSCVLDLGCGCGVPMARALTDHGHDVTGVDISAVQIERARQLVPAARFIRADVATLTFAPGSFSAIVCLYTLIHLPVEEQHALLHDIGTWPRPDGLLLTTVGATAWTGEEADWLGSGKRMWWSHPDADTYRRWLAESGLTIVHDEFIPEGTSGHQLFLAQRQH
jgi:SAM-dependent methyltransferase